jgi:leucyl-tRNA synthetase
VLSFVMQNFLKVLGLFCPHLADHLWRNVFGAHVSLFRQSWVPVNKELTLLSTRTVSVALSVDGKRRNQLEVSKGMSDEELKAIIEGGSVGIDRFLVGREIVRLIVVRGNEGEPKVLNVVTAARAQ